MPSKVRVLGAFVVLLLLTSALFGQTAISITGTVKDPEGAVVQGAKVLLIARDNTVVARTVTNGVGHYSFDHLPPGAYLVSATAAGFESAHALTVNADKPSQFTADLTLRLSAVSTAITVTASGTAQNASETAKAVTVIDSSLIDSLGKSSPVAALSYVPGLRIQQLGGPGGQVSVRVRGLRTQDTAVLMDGFRLRDASSTQGDATSLLQDLIVTNTDRIEVLRGTGSSLYGTDATGGVVNIITGTPGGKPHSTVLLEGGSLGTFRGQAGVSGGLGGDKFGYSLGLAHLNVTSGLDGQLPDRTSSLQGQFNYAVSSRTRVTGRLFISDSFSRVTDSPTVVGNVPATGVIDGVALSNSELRRYENGTPVSDLNVGNATFIPNADNPDYNRTARTYSGALVVSSHPTDSVGLSASYQGLAVHRDYTNGPLGLGYQPYGGSEIYTYDGTIHTAAGRMDWRLGKYQTINAGYEFEHETYDGVTLEPSSADNSSASVTQKYHALFIQDQLHLLQGRLQVAGSYRAQLFSLDAPTLLPSASAPYAGAKFSAPPTSSTWDGSVAYFLHDAGTKFRAHVGSGYRAPSLYERFGTYFGSYYGYTAYGNPDLKPERTLGFDAGVDQRFWGGKAQASASYFYTRLQDVIMFGNVDPTTDPYGRYYGYSNTHGGIARGVESSLSVVPIRMLRLQATYTFTNAREAKALVPGVYQTYVTPDHQGSILAVAHVTPRLELLFGTVFTSSYLAPIYDSATYASRAFRFAGAKQGQVGMSYRVPLGESRAVRFFANVQNAFNQSYYESGYRTPGTTAMSGMRFEF